MKCSCGGDIVTTNKPRDGERAGCSRCHSCISIASLIHRIDEQSDALDRAEAKIVRLYQRGSDTTSALNDEKDHLCLLAQLSAAVVGDCDERIAALESQNARMKAALETRLASAYPHEYEHPTIVGGVGRRSRCARGSAMTKEREDTRSDPPLTPATIREQAAYSLAIFGEDDGARWLLRCADRIASLESAAARMKAALTALVELPLFGPVCCYAHDDPEPGCAACDADMAYRRRCGEVEKQTRNALKESP